MWYELQRVGEYIWTNGVGGVKMKEFSFSFEVEARLKNSWKTHLRGVKGQRLREWSILSRVFSTTSQHLVNLNCPAYLHTHTHTRIYTFFLNFPKQPRFRVLVIHPSIENGAMPQYQLNDSYFLYFSKQPVNDSFLHTRSIHQSNV